MNTEAVVIYSDYKQVEKGKDVLTSSLTFNFIDITSKKRKKDGWSIKSYWGAKLDPYIKEYGELQITNTNQYLYQIEKIDNKYIDGIYGIKEIKLYANSVI